MELNDFVCLLLIVSLMLRSFPISSEYDPLKFVLRCFSSLLVHSNIVTIFHVHLILSVRNACKLTISI